MSRERFFFFVQSSIHSLDVFYGTISGYVFVVFLYLHFPLSDSTKQTIFLFGIRNSPTHASTHWRPDEMMNGKTPKEEKRKNEAAERKEDRHKNL